MPAPPPALYPENVLEDAIVTMTPDGPTTASHVERLVDRDIGFECEDSDVAGTRVWHFDRGVGASTPTVHVLILAGAAMAGEGFVLESSTDDAAWTSRGTPTPAADAPERFVLTPFTVPRYIRLTTSSPAAPVRFTEITLAPQIAFEWKPAARDLREPQIPNVVLVESATGRDWGIQRARRRWSTRYLMSASPDSDYTTLLGILDTLADGAKPFWLLDVRSVLRWVRINGAVEPQAVDSPFPQRWDIPATFVEVLP